MFVIVCDIIDFILMLKWMTVIVFSSVYDDVSLCSSSKVRDRRYWRYDIISSCVEAMWFSSRSLFWITIYNVRYHDTSWCFADDIIYRLMLTDVHWLLTTDLYVSAMISFRNVLYHMYFRCFVRRCSTHASVRMFQSDESYAKYCLRYSLLASQSKLRLVACESRWAGNVNNATASGSQLLAI